MHFIIDAIYTITQKSITIDHMINKTKVGVVGAGNVGCALALCLANHGYLIELISRDPQRTINRFSMALAANGFNQPANLNIRDHPSSFGDIDILLLCVPDSAIEATCQSLSEKLCGNEIVVHCSGALDSSILVSAKQRGCSTASAHPLNTFPNLSASLTTLRNGHNSYLYCEGDEAALSMIQTVFTQVGFNTKTIQAENKVLYHAACVFASNYLTVLMDMSLQTAQAANIDHKEFLQASQPIVKATLTHLEHYSTAAALSGPLARGDMQTVEQHIKSLSDEAPELSKAYQVFADYAVTMLKRK